MDDYQHDDDSGLPDGKPACVSKTSSHASTLVESFFQNGKGDGLTMIIIDKINIRMIKIPWHIG